MANILIWNVRGLNKKSHRDVVRQLINTTRPDVVCLQETKTQNMKNIILLSSLGQDFDNHVLCPAVRIRGGILIACKGAKCLAMATWADTYSCSVQFRNAEGMEWCLTGVYGPQLDAHNLLFLQELRDVRAACTGPWAVVW